MNDNNTKLSLFCQDFSQYLADNQAHNNLSHKLGKDPSGPIIYYPDWSDKKMIWWKINKNIVTLQLMGEYQGLAKNMNLPVGVEIKKFPRSESLFYIVPKVDLSKSLDAQIDIIEVVIDSVIRLISIVREIEENFLQK